MPNGDQGRIRIGVGGWTYEPWRGDVLSRGSRRRSASWNMRAAQLTTIEINGTYYGSQKPESFRKWHDETPDDFVFSLKAPRFATNRRVLAEAGESIDRFFASGVMELGDKLGPVNWQFMADQEVRSGGFRGVPEAAAEGGRRPGDPARRRGPARELQGAGVRRPDPRRTASPPSSRAIPTTRQIADVTAAFVYARIMGTKADEPNGYSGADARRLGGARAGLGVGQARQRGWRPSPTRRRTENRATFSSTSSAAPRNATRPPRWR